MLLAGGGAGPGVGVKKVGVGGGGGVESVGGVDGGLETCGCGLGGVGDVGGVGAGVVVSTGDSGASGCNCCSGTVIKRIGDGPDGGIERLISTGPVPTSGPPPSSG